MMKADNSDESICSPARLIIISHVKDEVGSNGGSVYTRGVVDILKGAFSDVQTVYVHEDPINFRKLRIIAAFFGAFVSGLPAKALYFLSYKAARRIRRATAVGRADLVIFDHLETSLYSRLIGGKAKAILIQHNDEVKLLANRVIDLKWRLGRSILASDVARLAKFQCKAFERIKNVIFLSADEAAAADSAIANKFTLLPSFDYQPARLRNASRAGKDVVFIGNMNWWPNVDAVNWFVNEVLNSIDNDITFHVVGHGSHRWSQSNPHIKTYGFVENREDAWGISPIFIAPVRLGAGVNIKVAEAIYNGRALIATPQALRGIPLEEDEAIVVVESTSEWVDCLNDPLRLEALAQEIPKDINRDLFRRSLGGKSLVEYVENILTVRAVQG
ncbi:glycosyltransferase [Paraburkholderia aspalathi]|uniref:glycosyltransferase n=1 Tax=Paraburkholderia nemoris TaxID=2793076 RepID=UPI001909D076|nr:glycosyltransferase [Paraburkholderia nemoris]MBK3740877.1 glycosyltransferase [Paraburkholderia aspalathi]